MELDIIKTTSQKARKANFVLALIIILIGILIAPLFIDGLIADMFLQVCFYCLIMFTMYTLESDRKVLFAALLLAIPILFCNLLGIYYNSLTISMLNQSLLTAYLIFSMVFITTQVVRESLINMNLIFGAIMVYFLAGIVWGKLYWLTNVYYPDSFKGLEVVRDKQLYVDNILKIQFDLIYYSFTTMATLGLGDIVPVHRLVRSLTILQASFGNLFIAITISKMVSIWNTSRFKSKASQSS